MNKYLLSASIKSLTPKEPSFHEVPKIATPSSILCEVLNDIDPNLTEKVITGLCSKFEALLQQAYKEPYKDAFNNRIACSDIDNIFLMARLPTERLEQVRLKVHKEHHE